MDHAYHRDYPSCCSRGSPLVSLDTAIRLSVLAKAIVLSWLVVIATTAAARGLSASRPTGLATLLARLDGVDLALRKLTGVDALVWLAVLAETVVLCGTVSESND